MASEITLLVRSDFPPKVATLKLGNDTKIPALKAAAAKAIGFDVAPYSLTYAAHGGDAVPLLPDFGVKDDTDIAGLVKSGDSASSTSHTLVLIAPANLRPPRRVIAKPKAKDEKSDGKEKKELKIDVEQAFAELAKAKTKAQKDLVLSFIDKNAKKVFESKAFLKATKKDLQGLLARDGLAIKEIDLFNCILKWAGGQLKSEDPAARKEFLKELIPMIRFPLMQVAELASVVVPTGLLEMQQQLDLFQYVTAREAKKKSGGGKVELAKSIAMFNDNSRKPAIELKWDSGLSRNVTISEDGYAATHNGTDGAAFCTTGFTEGKHRWTIDVVYCEGNCMDIGISCRHDQNDSQRVSGIHAGGTSIQIQSGCGSSRGSGSWSRFSAGTIVHVLLDMDARTLNFNVNGVDTGPIIHSLPAKVYPACDLRQRSLGVKIRDYREGWE